MRTVFCCPLDPPLPSRPSRARLIFVGEVAGTRTGDRVRFAWRIFDLPHDNHQSDLRDARDKGDYCHSPRRPALLKRMRIVNTSCETLWARRDALSTNKPQRPAKPRYATTAAHTAQDPASTAPTSKLSDSAGRAQSRRTEGSGCHATKTTGVMALTHAAARIDLQILLTKANVGSCVTPRGRPEREFKC